MDSQQQGVVDDVVLQKLTSVSGQSTLININQLFNCTFLSEIKNECLRFLGTLSQPLNQQWVCLGAGYPATPGSWGLYWTQLPNLSC